MRKKLVRFYGRGHLHFITFSCYRRRCLLGRVRARNLFVQVLREVRGRYKFRLVGYVVMPEHVHLLLSEPGIGTPSKVVQALKQSVSRRMRGRKARSGRSSQLFLSFARGDSSPHFWQRRFYDFNVWSDKKKVEKLEFMHRNSVTRGLVRDPKDWPWSSYSYFSGRDDRLIEIDPV
ncbi:MAG: REP-associated tyrosine transposase [Nitrososphaerales archaeon]